MTDQLPDGLGGAVRSAFDRFGPPEDTDRPAFVVRSPGRVNLIGDHIDYSGGSVLPMALDRGTTAVVIPRRDQRIRGFSENFPQQGVVSATVTRTDRDPEHGWFSYVLGVVHTAQAQGMTPDSGFDIWLSGNIPEGGGLSSSASVELAVATALERLFRFGLSPTDWAVLCQRAENAYVGVNCGIMDQLAIARGRAGHAILMDCRTLACEYVPLPAERTAVLIASTNQPRRLADSAYNERRAAVERATEIIAEVRGEPLADLVAIGPDELAEYAEVLGAEGVWAFARHTSTEQQRVLAAADALRSGDLSRVGQLMRESHESLRDDFAVTGPYLDALVEAAWAAPGVIGARMTGAGFGGCTVNLVTPGAEADATEAIRQGYRRATGVEAEIFAVTAAPGARVVAEV